MNPNHPGALLCGVRLVLCGVIAILAVVAAPPGTARGAPLVPDGSSTRVAQAGAPRVIATTPADGATGVPAHSTIELSFSEPVAVAFTGILLECPTGAAIAYNADPALPATATTAIRLTPLAPLPAETVCRVSVLASGIQGAAGSALDGNADGLAGDDYRFSFTTGAPPQGDPSGAPLGGFDPALSIVGVLAPDELGLPGETITWTLRVTNTGSAPGANVVVTDTLRPELRVGRVESTAGAFNVRGQVVTLVIPALAPGETVTLRITTTVLRGPADGMIVNTASVTSAGVTERAHAAVAVPSLLPKTGYPAGRAPRAPSWVWLLLAAGIAAAMVLRDRARRTRPHL